MTRSLRGSLLVFLLVLVATPLLARIGGGHSYSDGSDSSSSSSSGSSSDADSSDSSSSHSSDSSESWRSPGSSGSPVDDLRANLFSTLVFGLMAVMILGGVVQRLRELDDGLRHVRRLGASWNFTPAALGEDPLAIVRRADPTFSAVIFEDFCYSLFDRVHRARGNAELQRYAPFLSEAARKMLAKRVAEVSDVIIGGFHVQDAGMERENLVVRLLYEANLTETTASGEQAIYLSEQWLLERRVSIASPPPSKGKADHCPRCGAALGTRSDGSCEHCGTIVRDGSFHWFVRGIVVLKREQRGPILTSHAPEVGGDLPTQVDPHLEWRWREFLAAHPTFSPDAFLARISLIAETLQRAWSERDWEPVRPLETEGLFQMHRYWIDAYIRQGLRNVVEDFRIHKWETAKIESDPYYDAFTMRMFASGRDYTVDEESGHMVSGSISEMKHWTEYWTFIRGRGEGAPASATIACANCGAAVTVGSSGICPYCQGKTTTAVFDWILSRIQQDEAYRQ